MRIEDCLYNFKGWTGVFGDRGEKKKQCVVNAKKNASLKRNEVSFCRWSLYLNYSHWGNCAGGKENGPRVWEQENPGCFLGIGTSIPQLVKSVGFGAELYSLPSFQLWNLEQLNFWNLIYSIFRTWTIILFPKNTLLNESNPGNVVVTMPSPDKCFIFMAIS